MPLVGELVRNNINQGREEDAKMLPCHLIVKCLKQIRRVNYYFFLIFSEILATAVVLFEIDPVSSVFLS